MDAFRARTRASRSLFKNPAVQIGGLAVVLIASFVFIRASNKSKAERMAADTPIIREVDQQETELAQAQAEQRAARRAMNETSSASVTAPTIDAEQAPPTVASNASTDSVSAGGAPSGTTAGSPAAATPATGASLAAAKLVDGKPQAGIRAALQGPQNVRVYFIEAQRGFLNELMSDARDVSGDGVVNYGVVANLDQRLRNSRAWQSLDSSLDQPMKLNQPNMIFKGARDQVTGQNIGFTVQVIPLSRDEAGSHLQIDANRTLRDPMNGVDSVTFQMPESFSIPKGASVVITGVLPHRNVGPEEQAFYRSVNVLKAMGGERFRSGATDVAIIVQTR